MLDRLSDDGVRAHRGVSRAADGLRCVALPDAARAACEAVGALLARDLARAGSLAPIGGVFVTSANASASASALGSSRTAGGGAGAAGAGVGGSQGGWLSAVSTTAADRAGVGAGRPWISPAMASVIATLDDYVTDLRSSLGEYYFAKATAALQTEAIVAYLLQVVM